MDPSSLVIGWAPVSWKGSAIGFGQSHKFERQHTDTDDTQTLVGKDCDIVVSIQLGLSNIF